MDFSMRDRLRLLATLGALSAVACAGGKQSAPILPSQPVMRPASPPRPPGSTAILKEIFATDFRIGAAVQTAHVTSGGPDQSLAETHFNSFTSEFEMKANVIAPTEGNYNFAPADDLLAFVTANAAALRGHALLWYRSTPDYFTIGSASDIRCRLEAYIEAVVTRYAGQIYAWDVVNEVVSDDAAETYRQDAWYQAVGKDFIDWAFKAARAADPGTRLFINDYNTEFSGKRGRLITVIRDLLDRGIPIDGVGHQFHLSVGISADQVLEAIDEIDALGAGLEQHVTELDVSVYSDPAECFGSRINCQTSYGPSPTDVPYTIYQQQAQLYRDLLAGFRVRDSVTSVSVWGLRDSESWLNNFPVSRSNYPLLFDRNGHSKSAFQAIADPDYVI